MIVAWMEENVSPPLNGRVLFRSPGASDSGAGRLSWGSVRKNIVTTRSVLDAGLLGKFASCDQEGRYAAFLTGEGGAEHLVVLDLRHARRREIPTLGRCTGASLSPDGRFVIAFVAASGSSGSSLELRRLPNGERVTVEHGYKAAFWINHGSRALWVEDRLDGSPLSPPHLPSYPDPTRVSRTYGLIDARTGASHAISNQKARQVAPVLVRALERHYALTRSLYYPGQIGIDVSPDGQKALVSVDGTMRTGKAGATELFLPEGVTKSVVGYERAVSVIGWRGRDPVGYDGYHSWYGVGLISAKDGRYRRLRVQGPDSWLAYLP